MALSKRRGVSGFGWSCRTPPPVNFFFAMYADSARTLHFSKARGISAKSSRPNGNRIWQRQGDYLPRFPFSIIFQLQGAENRKNAANSAFVELDYKLPKLPLVTPNTLNWRHLTETKVLVIGK